MATMTEEKLYTMDDLLAMPDDGIERWIIKGQLREKLPEIEGATMTIRNFFHSECMALIAGAITLWRRTQPKPCGHVACGEVGVRFPNHPDDAVGLDLVFVGPDAIVKKNRRTTMIEGVPLLCVEILSPSDTTEAIQEKLDTYLDHGVPVTWIVNPYQRTVTVHSPDKPAISYNMTQSISEHAAMPGFAPTVAELFE